MESPLAKNTPGADWRVLQEILVASVAVSYDDENLNTQLSCFGGCF